ncbi:hypothetical protein OG223_17950 [Streptomyces sp. NBC_01478]|uniref:hypothetical protein n=1 Tax=Streptomyces sp. NBC_01478 TaxID=2903882 RepID=UPI002E37FA19|nr:hypothetical protein [Streptomyces sp. NBC_01478]
MGSGAGFIVVPLFFYVTLCALLCVKIADKNTWKMGLLFATPLIFLPAAFVVIVGIHAAGAL